MIKKIHILFAIALVGMFATCSASDNGHDVDAHVEEKEQIRQEESACLPVSKYSMVNDFIRKNQQLIVCCIAFAGSYAVIKGLEMLFVAGANQLPGLCDTTGFFCDQYGLTKELAAKYLFSGAFLAGLYARDKIDGLATIPVVFGSNYLFYAISVFAQSMLASAPVVV